MLSPPRNTGASAVAALLVAAVAISCGGAALESLRQPALGEGDPVPELVGITGWINTDPFTLESLRGRVVLIDIWTYTCINCIRTFPHLKDWHKKYSELDLVIVGVHSPEFEFEKERANVEAAVERFGLEYPVVQDNDFETFHALGNRYWPAKYLVDKEGIIRYTHHGEGAYAETEMRIRELLEETGAAVTSIAPDVAPEPADLDPDQSSGLTRELYAGYERNYGALRARRPPYVRHEEYFREPDVDVLYDDPGDHQNHYIYLHGLWRNGPESLTHARRTEGLDDYLAIHFFATTVNVVLAAGTDGPYRVHVAIDGRPLRPSEAGADIHFDDDGSYVSVERSSMYRLVELPKFGGHELNLSSRSLAFSVFAFTFGADESQPGSP